MISLANSELNYKLLTFPRQTSSKTHTYTPTATAVPGPLTSLAVSVSKTQTTLFAGSWDKNIYAWPLSQASKASNSTTIVRSTGTLAGHSDFVKALLAFPVHDPTSPPLLASGSSDATIIIWNAITYEKLHVLTGHSRAVQAFALDPYSIPEPGPRSTDSGMVLFSGDSNREIRAWHISPTSASEVPTDLVSAGDEFNSDTANAHPAGTVAPLVVHETSLFGLEFNSVGDLWTASADRTAKCLSRERKFQADTTLEHPDYVRCIGVSEELGVVVTGCRDENVRVWDNGSGDCVAVLGGHWEEVTGVAVIGKMRQLAVSVSIDGTVRKWGLSREELARSRAEKDEEIEAEKEKGSGMTEEEERELAELMDESD